jgi:PASTA domain
VADFTGGTVEDARLAAADYDWKLKTRKQPSSEEPGTVIGQDPAEGTKLKAGRSILLTVATPKPRQWVTLGTLSGAGGASKSDEFRIPEGRVRLLYNMPGEGNNAITLYKAPDEYVDLLVNEIGPVNGRTRVYPPGTYYLDVTGDSYTVQIQQYK